MRFTESQDGVRRATLRMEMRVGRDAIMTAVAEMIYEEMSNRPPTTRAAVEAQLRNLAIRQGLVPSMWQLDIDEEDWDWIRPEADIATDRLFPELTEVEL